MRGASDERQARPEPEPFLETARFLAGSRTFLLILAGVTFMGANIFAAGAWTPTFLDRVHDLSMSEVASSIGPIRGLLGAVGILAGGFAIDRLAPPHVRWRIRLPALACILAGPAEALFLLGDPQWLWLLGFAMTSFFTLLHQGPIYAATMEVARLRMRATAIAILIFCASLLGQAVGPFAVGTLNDALAASLGDEAIRYSLLIIALTPILAGLCFWAAASHYVADVERAGNG